jgi:rhamnulokinase
LGLDPALFPALRRPGDRIGELDGGGTPVFAVGSHDTASAVVGVPADTDRFAYISCGTWSLVGVELDRPVLTEESRLANFTNELGVDDRVRYLRNVMGLWLLQESVRVWSAAGLEADLPGLLDDAGRAPAFVSLINPDDPSFLPPGDMPARIADLCRRTGQPAPADPAATVRCVLESIALAHRRTVRAASALSGRDVDVVHIVGGGARNALLCQLTADACGLPVVAGPVEATASGNVLVQARALGVIGGDLTDLRSLLRRDADLVRYEPDGDTGAWDAAETRIYST